MTFQPFVRLSKRIRRAQTIKPTAEEAEARSISGTVTAAHNVSHQAAQKSVTVITPLASLIVSSRVTRLQDPRLQAREQRAGGGPI
jgi:hypothetical protein